MNRKAVYVLVIVAVVVLLALLLILPSRNAARQMENQMGTGSQPVPQAGGAAPASAPAEFNRPLGQLQLMGLLTGEEAANHISQLHGTTIPMDESYMAMYGKEGQQVVLWVSRSNKEQDAEALLRAMDEKMPQSQAFTNYRKQVVAGRQVYRVDGGGMDNFYYRQGRAVFWVGVQGGDPEGTLSLVLDNFRDFK